MQHRVMQFGKINNELECERKIISFDIVDPNKRIISTKDVPYQNWKWKKPLLEMVLNKKFKNKDIIKIILKYTR